MTGTLDGSTQNASYYVRQHSSALQVKHAIYYLHSEGS